MIDVSNHASILTFLQSQGYLIVFLAMFIEGPVITLAAAFAASMDYFNVYIIFLLSFLSRFILDSIFFLIGRLGRRKSTENYIHKLGLNESQIQKIESGFQKHFGKSLIMIKITPFISIPGIILAGFMKNKIKKFVFFDILINLITSAIFTLLGFYFGVAMNPLVKYFKLGGYAFLVLIPLIIILYFVINRFRKKYKYNQ